MNSVNAVQILPELHKILNEENQQVGVDVLNDKYFKGDEKTPYDLFKRVAKGLTANYKDEEQKQIWTEKYLEQFAQGYGVGAGRIMSATGVSTEATSINCFVLEVGDAIDGCDENNIPGIYETLKNAAVTLRRGGGCGYNFSNIRPRGAFVKGTNSYASGPCSYIDVYDKSCATVESAGGRRGAQMGILDISHPDIEEFITAKRTAGRWNYFNVSVYVTDAFMKAVADNEDWVLYHAKPHSSLPKVEHIVHGHMLGYVYKTVKAAELWDTIMKSNYDFAEPGVLFEDSINKDNNLRYIEKIKATNPCAEQPLPPNGCCDLGPLNVSRFVVNKFTEEAYFDYEKFAKAVEVQVQMLDDVLDVTFWPLDAQRKESDSKRRIGVGITGLGTALMYLCVPYNSRRAMITSGSILDVMRDASYLKSIALAKERGAFPLLDVNKYLEEGTFASRLPQSTKESIVASGIRNSHLLSIAPTGTVSLAFFDNVTSGIEPAFSLLYKRKVRDRFDANKHHVYYVLDKGLKEYLRFLVEHDQVQEANDIFTKLSNGEKAELPDFFVTAMDMSVEEHMGILKIAAPLIDTAISKTVNVPADFPYESFKDIYTTAHTAGLKGISTYRPNLILGSVLEEIKPKEEVIIIDVPMLDAEEFLFGTIEKLPEARLPAIRGKISYQSADGKEQIYVVVSYLSKTFDAEGRSFTLHRPIEVFITTHDQSSSPEWLNAQSISMSLLARCGLKMFHKTLGNMRAVRSPRGAIRYGHGVKEDGSKYPLWHESSVAVVAYEVLSIMANLGVVDKNSHELLSLSDIVESSNVSIGFDIKTETTEEAKLDASVFKHGKKCNECGAHAVIKADGCERCTNCNAIGSCG